MTDYDLVDTFYRHLVRPLGNLVILCAQAEASLLDLIAVLQSSDELQAQAVLKSKDTKQEVLALIRTSTLQDCSRSELLEAIESYWNDRLRRNRYYHDEWFVAPSEGGFVSIRGLPWKKGSGVVFDDPTADEIWALAARFREHDHLFSHTAWALRRSHGDHEN